MSRFILCAVGAMLWPVVTLADVPKQINHQGVVTVDGVRFDGTGLFRFAIVDPDAPVNLWSNDGSITGAVGGIPTVAVSLTVTDGVYSVLLGDTSLANMTDQIASSLFNDDNAVLRIWFDDGVNGLQQLAPDHPLTTNPYSFRLPGISTSDDGKVGIAGPPDQERSLQVSGYRTDNRIRMKQTLLADTAAGAIEFADANDDVKWSIGTNINIGPGFEINNSTVPGTNAFYIDPSGHVGIGTTTPNANLTIQHETSDGSNAIFVNSTADPLITGPVVEVRNTTAGSGTLLALSGDADGNEGGPWSALIVEAGGTIRGRFGTYHSPSDGRLKRDVVTISNALQRVLALRGINFKWKDSHLDGDSLQIGLIAQEVEKVFPEAVHTAKDKMGTKAVEYEHLIGALVEAIKELDGIVKQKDADLRAQARQIGSVESRLAALEARLPKLAQAEGRD